MGTPQFSRSIITEWLNDGIRMRVVYDVTYIDSNGREWLLKAGFTTDGASIPHQLWSIVGAPYNGKYRVAALFHDAAYADPGVPKPQADLMFRNLCIDLGCDHSLAEVLYTGVRLAGGSSYTNDQYDSALVLVKAQVKP